VTSGPYSEAALPIWKVAEDAATAPLVTTWYIPGVVTREKSIGYTSGYVEFHFPRLVVVTVPEATVVPDESTTR
jgi:hypothetical protein